MMNHSYEPVLAIEAAMTDQEKSIFFTHVLRRNPQYRGAAVADILEIFDDSDAFIGWTERAIEDDRDDLIVAARDFLHGDEATAVQVVRLAVLACALLVQSAPRVGGVAFLVGRTVALFRSEVTT